MTKRVLLIGMTPNPGGLETYMINIFSKLQNKGFQFDFVNTFDKPIAYNDFILKNGGRIYNSYIRKDKLKYFTRHHDANRFFKHHHNYDIVHINALSVNEAFWVKSAKKYGERHIIFQSHESGDACKSTIIRLIKKIPSIYNRNYLNNNTITKLAASYSCGYWMFGNDSKFQVINNGINTKLFYPNYHERKFYRNKLNINPECKVLITTARLHKQKNYPKIINIFKCIHKLYPNTVLVIIGSGEEYMHIKHMINLFKLTPYVYFLGTQSKIMISKLLNIGDLMLMPSLFEAVPFSLTEAQSVGIPALVSLYRIPKEANITSKLTYISLKRSSNYWAHKALKILNKPYNFNTRLTMNNCVKKSNYNIQRSIKNVKNIYLDICK